jgi:hypothetical protein
MPKYYVSSGDLQKIISAENHKKAAIAVFEQLDALSVDSLGIITLVSERGFDAFDDDDVYFPTMDLLEAADQLGNYKLEDWL